MRKLLGSVVLVAGVGGLGWYGSANNAKTMQSEVTAGAQSAAQGTIHPIETRVSGRDIVISGIANSEAERDQILATMGEVDGRRVVHDELQVLDTASPFTFDANKNAAREITYAGMVPTEVARESLAGRIGDAAAGLDLMAGAPDGDWTSVIGKGLNGLDALQDGALLIVDQEITVTGTALTPDIDAAARAALGDLPEGYSANFDITVLDDGTPLRLTIDRTEDGAVAAIGKIPATLAAADLSAELGTDIGTEIEQSALPTGGEDWSDVSKLGAAALGKLRSGQLQITEDSVSLTGVANPQNKADAEAMLASLPEGFSATTDIALYDDGAPFSLEMMSDGQTVTAAGKFPAELAAADVIGDVPATDIRNAFISDETGGFATAATNGVEALDQLEQGQLRVVGTDVTLTGTARTPAEADAAMAALEGLPDGYVSSFDIMTIDDGTPPSFEVTYQAASGASISGKLPSDTDVQGVADALGLPSISGSPVQSLIETQSQAAAQLAAVSGWLPELDELTFTSNDDVVEVTAIAAPGVEQDLVQAGLAADLGDGASVTVSAPNALPEDGTERINQATGRSEAFTGGFWLPVLDFTSDAETCDARTRAALEEDRIGFVTGSAQLDGQSVRAINAIASVIRKCLADTELNAEIGGHTDSQGGDDLNLELSQARADAVRTALIARGITQVDITARGYGEAEPIADNETEEGRAANRRTTIAWLARTQDAPAVDEEPTDEAVETETNTEVGE